MDSRKVLACAAALCAVLVAAVTVPAPATAQTPQLTAPRQVAGSLSGAALGGMSIARDGTGGLAYTADVGGTPHVFVSRLTGGSFGSPVRLDAGMSGASSQPVIAADNGGILLVAFVNGGTLYASEVTSSAQSSFSSPQALGTGASNPSIAMDLFGVGYLAFTTQSGGSSSVDVEYWDGTSWAAAAPEAVNASSDDGAGMGTGAPSVACAGDGIGIVAWGEGGHVYSRRVWGTQTSVETEQLDPSSLGGADELSADDPQVSVGGNSSYVDVAFHAQFAASGGQATDRVLVGRLLAEDTIPATAVDGVGTTSTTSSSAPGATDPQIAMNEYGRGFITATIAPGNSVVATPLGTNGGPGSAETIDPGPYPTAPFAVPGIAGLISTEIAWQQVPAATGVPQIALSYAADGVDLAPPVTVSSPAAGPTDAADGLAAGGDGNGDAVAAWVQGAPGDLAIETAQLYQGPGQAIPITPGAGTTTYSVSATPTLSWAAAREDWGPVTYAVTLDGQLIGTTTQTQLTVPAALTDGPHTWSVTATNPAGLSSTGPGATVFVDTYPPNLRIRLSGAPRAHQTVTVVVASTDLPSPGERGAAASGVAAVTISWGDRTRTQAATGPGRLHHTYARPGLYRVVVTATDRAGNTTTLSRYLRVLS